METSLRPKNIHAAVPENSTQLLSYSYFHGNRCFIFGSFEKLGLEVLLIYFLKVISVTANLEPSRILKS